MIRWSVASVLAILVSVFGTFLATPQPVQACSCVVFAPPEQLEMASTVFHGRVTALEPFTPTADSPEPWLDSAVQFEVETVWKGTVAGNIVIAVVSATEACGFRFDVGEEYLVYADGPPFYDTSWCSGTKVFDGDIAHLGEGRAPLPGIDEQALAYDQRHIGTAAAESDPLIEALPETVEPEPPPLAEAPTDAMEPDPIQPVEAPPESAEPEPPPVASQEPEATGWIWITVGVGVAATVGGLPAIAWARRRGKSSA